jgi:hypothetical protein
MLRQPYILQIYHLESIVSVLNLVTLSLKGANSHLATPSLLPLPAGPLVNTHRKYKIWAKCNCV